MRALKPRDTPDLAAVTLTFPAGPEADRIERALLDLQGPDGGWGPFPNVRSEPFDTAIAVLALRSRPATSARSAAIARGLDYLRSSIGDDGSWVETTRPAGQRSYAQRLSTTGWAVMALLSKDVSALSIISRSGDRGIADRGIGNLGIEGPSGRR